MTAAAKQNPIDERAIFAGRIDILYALGRHYLSLPFAVLCVPATRFGGSHTGFIAADAARCCRSRW